MTKPEDHTPLEVVSEFYQLKRSIADYEKYMNRAKTQLSEMLGKYKFLSDYDKLDVKNIGDHNKRA